MKVLANENVGGPIVRKLRDLGHDVAWIREDAPGAPDPEVIQRARIEGRVLVTFDKEFGDLAVRSGMPAECGVLLLRLGGRSAAQDNQRAVAAITSRDSWAGILAIVEDDRIRTRPMPG